MIMTYILLKYNLLNTEAQQEVNDFLDFLLSIQKTKKTNSNLYFCQKFKSESPESIVPEFEENFVRLEYVENDNFNFSYFRHTGQWFPVATNLSLNNCLEMIADNPNFHPIG